MGTSVLYLRHCERVSAQRPSTCARPRTTSRLPKFIQDLRASTSLGLRATHLPPKSQNRHVSRQPCTRLLSPPERLSRPTRPDFHPLHPPPPLHRSPSTQAGFPLPGSPRRRFASSGMLSRIRCAR